MNKVSGYIPSFRLCVGNLNIVFSVRTSVPAEKSSGSFFVDNFPYNGSRIDSSRVRSKMPECPGNF